jgi:hypothetical protein
MGAPRGRTILSIALLLCFALTTHTVLCSEQSTLAIRVNVSIDQPLYTADCPTSFTDDQESDIHDCIAVQKLSALKRTVDDDESPIMRQVFGWLFPFGPGWNAGLSFPLYENPGTFVNICRSSGNVLHQLVRLLNAYMVSKPGLMAVYQRSSQGT